MGGYLKKVSKILLQSDSFFQLSATFLETLQGL